MKARDLDGFGARLAQLRQQRGLSQEELARAVDVSRRVIAYYEAESDQPPGALLADLAQALRVSADELLGLKTISKIGDLPAADQRTVLKLLDALLAARQRTRPRRVPASR